MARILNEKKVFFRRCYFIKIVPGDCIICSVIFIAGKEIDRTFNGLQTFKKIYITSPGKNIEPGSPPSKKETFSQTETYEFLPIMFKQPFTVIIQLLGIFKRNFHLRKFF